MSDDKTFPLVPCRAAPDGTIMTNAAKYGRLATLAVFEMIGGTEQMAKWAADNRTDFYTKLFPKVINKDVDVNTGGSVDELIRRLNDRNPMPDEDVIEVTFNVVADKYSEFDEDEPAAAPEVVIDEETDEDGYF